MLLAIKIFIMFFFVVPLTGAILFLIVAADAMKRDEETGRAQIRRDGSGWRSAGRRRAPTGF
ncbi:MAG: hypothetical protein V8Q79_04205 [Christensenellales bacterium]